MLTGDVIIDIFDISLFYKKLLRFEFNLLRTSSSFCSDHQFIYILYVRNHIVVRKYKCIEFFSYFKFTILKNISSATANKKQTTYNM